MAIRSIPREFVTSTDSTFETSLITEAKLRRWLTLLRKPDQLASPEVSEMLRAHGKLPDTPNGVEVGQAAAHLLIDTIEKLRPPAGAGREEELPHLVLQTCFIEGAKLFQAAGRLGLSERQLTRERSRAIGMLKAKLDSPLIDLGGYRPEPIPTIRGYLPRPASHRALESALESHHLVNVHGPPGIGKTSLVAELASEVSEEVPVLWYRLRHDVNDSLSAILFEFGEYLRHRGSSDLARYVTQSLPNLDVALATRLALKGLDGADQLIVFDDYHLVEDDAAIAGVLDEMVLRLPRIRLVTISRHRYSRTQQGSSFEVSPMSRSETKSLLTHLGVEASLQMVRSLHSWTEGNTNLIKLAASWLKTATDDEVARGVKSLRNQTEVQSFLLNNVTDLLDSDDRAVLEAASVFRDRFNDDALSFVSRRTRGEVMDASLRLVRNYAATRSREGDSAFFHASVRDYVYERLAQPQKATLHERCALWYERNDQEDEAKYHSRKAKALSGTPAAER